MSSGRDRRQIVADIHGAMQSMRAQGQEPAGLFLHPQLLQDIAQGVFHVCLKCGDKITTVPQPRQDWWREKLWRLGHRLNCGK